LASPEVATMLENRIAAFDRADGRAAAAFYTKDAIMQEEDIGLTTKGRGQIATRLQFLMDAGLRMKTVGAPIQMGRFVGEAVRFYESGGTGIGEGVLVFELDKNSGKIAHQWVTGEVRG
jgi:ketosteroid isomerase-like protein